MNKLKIIQPSHPYYEGRINQSGKREAHKYWRESTDEQADRIRLVEINSWEDIGDQDCISRKSGNQGSEARNSESVGGEVDEIVNLAIPVN